MRNKPRGLPELQISEEGLEHDGRLFAARWNEHGHLERSDGIVNLRQIVHVHLGGGNRRTKIQGSAGGRASFNLSATVETPATLALTAGDACTTYAPNRSGICQSAGRDPYLNVSKKVAHSVARNATRVILCLSLAHLLPVHRKRSRAVAHDHPDGHDALRREEHVRPDDVLNPFQGSHAPPPQVSSHANEIDDAARADPPCRRSNFHVLGLKYMPRPVCSVIDLVCFYKSSRPGSSAFVRRGKRLQGERAHDP